MDIYFSTIVRAAPIYQAGELVRLNWETKHIEACRPILPDQPEVDDPHPRGNTRGGRGITLFGDYILCASWHSLIIYDRNLNEIRRITDPLMADLHEVYLEDDGTLFVACTALDAALQIDLGSGKILREYWPRSDPRLQQTLGVEPLIFDRNDDPRISFVTRNYREEPGHLHINTVSRLDGETYVLSNKMGTIINIDRGEVVLHHPALLGAHNLITDEEHFYLSGTTDHRVYAFDRKSGEPAMVIDLTDFPKLKQMQDRSKAPDWQHQLHKLKNTPLRMLKHTPMRRLYYRMGMNKLTPALPLFVRGLDIVGDMLFVGFSPATIASFDRKTGQLIDMYQYSTDVHECIHGLKVAA